MINADERILENLIQKYEELEKEIETLQDFKKIGSMKKEMTKMEKLYNMSIMYFKTKENIHWINNLDIEEQKAFNEDKLKLEKELSNILINVQKEVVNQKNIHLNKNIYLEIRAGTGGDEASLFADELYRMYEKYAQSKNLKLEVLDISYNDLGGIKSITTVIKGEWALKYFQFEKGTHRVQRVPVTEKKGRVHTSTVTVAILLEEEDDSGYFNLDDVKIEYSTSQGAGGQHVNKTESAVIMIHEPTGIRVKIQDERSQHKNKEKAASVLRMRVNEHVKTIKENAISEERHSQVGTGERSEKIRTYNFPQNRLTHHGFNITLHNLSTIMTSGNMDELFNLMMIGIQKQEGDNC